MLSKKTRFAGSSIDPSSRSSQSTWTSRARSVRLSSIWVKIGSSGRSRIGGREFEVDGVWEKSG